MFGRTSRKMVGQHQLYTTHRSKYASYARNDDVDQSTVKMCSRESIKLSKIFCLKISNI